MFKLQHKVFLAPMAGITDAPMRRIVFKKTDGKVGFISEMIAVNAISYKNKKTYQMADVRDEPYPVTIQLMGGDPILFEEVSKFVADLGAAGIDINMGCPVRKIIASGSGSSLMKDIKRASEIIKAVKKSVSLPVSVKFRKGWDENNVNAISFAKMCEESGADFITIHGRTKTQGYSGVADWDIIGKVKENVHIPVIGNGDINSVKTASKMFEQTRVDAVMVGRAALGNPFLLYKIATGKNINITPSTIYQTLLEHMNYLETYYGPKIALGLSRKYICWYSKSLFEAKKFRETYMKINNFDEALKALHVYFNEQMKGDIK